MTSFSYKSALTLGVAAVALTCAMPALAQAQPVAGAATDAAPQAADAGLEDIVVTATKRANAQNVQDVPFAVSAFGAAQLEQQHFTTLQSLSYSMPNVQLGQVGTVPGYANFSLHRSDGRRVRGRPLPRHQRGRRL
jgi:iron complex outermembrane receptor protein